MSGSYTSFEVEAERRREVLASSMRESHRHATVEGARRETVRPVVAADSHGLAAVAASLLSRLGQRT